MVLLITPPGYTHTHCNSDDIECSRKIANPALLMASAMIEWLRERPMT